MTNEERIELLEQTRQRDIDAMLLALLLIERGQIKDAAQTLIERLPTDISKRLKAGTP